MKNNIIVEEYMSSSNLHEFHFMIDKKMEESLRCLDLYLKTGSLSGTIVKILLLLRPILKKKHKWGKQKESRYLPVSSRPDVIRKHVHVYLPGDVYRELKLMHQDLNYYSIAQMMREFLGLFVFLVNRFGADVYKGLDRLFSQWYEEEVSLQLTPSKFVRQLWRIIQHYPDQNRLITIYSRNFAPLWSFRI